MDDLPEARAVPPAVPSDTLSGVSDTVASNTCHTAHHHSRNNSSVTANTTDHASKSAKHDDASFLEEAGAAAAVAATAPPTASAAAVRPACPASCDDVSGGTAPNTETEGAPWPAMLLPSQHILLAAVATPPPPALAETQRMRSSPVPAGEDVLVTAERDAAPSRSFDSLSTSLASSRHASAPTSPSILYQPILTRLTSENSQRITHETQPGCSVSSLSANGSATLAALALKTSAGASPTVRSLEMLRAARVGNSALTASEHGSTTSLTGQQQQQQQQQSRGRYVSPLTPWPQHAVSPRTSTQQRMQQQQQQQPPQQPQKPLTAPAQATADLVAELNPSLLFMVQALRSCKLAEVMCPVLVVGNTKAHAAAAWAALSATWGASSSASSASSPGLTAAPTSTSSPACESAPGTLPVIPPHKLVTVLAHTSPSSGKDASTPTKSSNSGGSGNAIPTPVSTANPNNNNNNNNTSSNSATQAGSITSDQSNSHGTHFGTLLGSITEYDGVDIDDEQAKARGVGKERQRDAAAVLSADFAATSALGSQAPPSVAHTVVGHASSITPFIDSFTPGAASMSANAAAAGGAALLPSLTHFSESAAQLINPWPLLYANDTALGLLGYHKLEDVMTKEFDEVFRCFVYAGEPVGSTTSTAAEQQQQQQKKLGRSLNSESGRSNNTTSTTNNNNNNNNGGSDPDLSAVAPSSNHFTTTSTNTGAITTTTTTTTTTTGKASSARASADQKATTTTTMAAPTTGRPPLPSIDELLRHADPAFASTAAVSPSLTTAAADAAATTATGAAPTAPPAHTLASRLSKLREVQNFDELFAHRYDNYIFLYSERTAAFYAALAVSSDQVELPKAPEAESTAAPRNPYFRLFDSFTRLKGSASSQTAAAPGGSHSTSVGEAGTTTTPAAAPSQQPPTTLKEELETFTFPTRSEAKATPKTAPSAPSAISGTPSGASASAAPAATHPQPAKYLVLYILQRIETGLKPQVAARTPVAKPDETKVAAAAAAAVEEAATAQRRLTEIYTPPTTHLQPSQNFHHHPPLAQRPRPVSVNYAPPAPHSHASQLLQPQLSSSAPLLGDTAQEVDVDAPSPLLQHNRQLLLQRQQQQQFLPIRQRGADSTNNINTNNPTMMTSATTARMLQGVESVEHTPLVEVQPCSPRSSADWTSSNANNSTTIHSDTALPVQPANARDSGSSHDGAGGEGGVGGRCGGGGGEGSGERGHPASSAGRGVRSAPQQSLFELSYAPFQADLARPGRTSSEYATEAFAGSTNAAAAMAASTPSFNSHAAAVSAGHGHVGLRQPRQLSPPTRDFSGADSAEYSATALRARLGQMSSSLPLAPSVNAFYASLTPQSSVNSLPLNTALAGGGSGGTGAGGSSAGGGPFSVIPNSIGSFNTPQSRPSSSSERSPSAQSGPLTTTTAQPSPAAQSIPAPWRSIQEVRNVEGVAQLAQQVREAHQRSQEHQENQQQQQQQQQRSPTASSNPSTAGPSTHAMHAGQPLSPIPSSTHPASAGPAPALWQHRGSRGSMGASTGTEPPPPVSPHTTYSANTLLRHSRVPSRVTGSIESNNNNNGGPGSRSASQLLGNTAAMTWQRSNEVDQIATKKLAGRIRSQRNVVHVVTSSRLPEMLIFNSVAFMIFVQQVLRFQERHGVTQVVCLLNVRSKTQLVVDMIPVERLDDAAPATARANDSRSTELTSGQLTPQGAAGAPTSPTTVLSASGTGVAWTKSHTSGEHLGALLKRRLAKMNAFYSEEESRQTYPAYSDSAHSGHGSSSSVSAHLHEQQQQQQQHDHDAPGTMPSRTAMRAGSFVMSRYVDGPLRHDAAPISSTEAPTSAGRVGGLANKDGEAASPLSLPLQQEAQLHHQQSADASVPRPTSPVTSVGRVVLGSRRTSTSSSNSSHNNNSSSSATHRSSRLSGHLHHHQHRHRDSRRSHTHDLKLKRDSSTLLTPALATTSPLLSGGVGRRVNSAAHWAVAPRHASLPFGSSATSPTSLGATRAGPPRGAMELIAEAAARVREGSRNISRCSSMARSGVRTPPSVKAASLNLHPAFHQRSESNTTTTATTNATTNTAPTTTTTTTTAATTTTTNATTFGSSATNSVVTPTAATGEAEATEPTQRQQPSQDGSRNLTVVQVPPRPMPEVVDASGASVHNNSSANNSSRHTQSSKSAMSWSSQWVNVQQLQSDSPPASRRSASPQHLPLQQQQQHQQAAPQITPLSSQTAQPMNFPPLEWVPKSDYLSNDTQQNLAMCDGDINVSAHTFEAQVRIPFITPQRLELLGQLGNVQLSSYRGLSVFGVNLVNMVTEEAAAAAAQPSPPIIPLQYDIAARKYKKDAGEKSTVLPPFNGDAAAELDRLALSGQHQHQQQQQNRKSSATTGSGDDVDDVDGRGTARQAEKRGKGGGAGGPVGPLSPVALGPHQDSPNSRFLSPPALSSPGKGAALTRQLVSPVLPPKTPSHPASPITAAMEYTPEAEEGESTGEGTRKKETSNTPAASDLATPTTAVPPAAAAVVIATSPTATSAASARKSTSSKKATSDGTSNASPSSVSLFAPDTHHHAMTPPQRSLVKNSPSTGGVDQLKTFQQQQQQQQQAVTLNPLQQSLSNTRSTMIEKGSVVSVVMTAGDGETATNAVAVEKPQRRRVSLLSMAAADESDEERSEEDDGHVSGTSSCSSGHDEPRRASNAGGNATSVQITAGGGGNNKTAGAPSTQGKPPTSPHASSNGSSSLLDTSINSTGRRKKSAGMMLPMVLTDPHEAAAATTPSPPQPQLQSEQQQQQQPPSTHVDGTAAADGGRMAGAAAAADVVAAPLANEKDVTDKAEKTGGASGKSKKTPDTPAAAASAATREQDGLPNITTATRTHRSTATTQQKKVSGRDRNNHNHNNNNKTNNNVHQSRADSSKDTEDAFFPEGLPRDGNWLVQSNEQSTSLTLVAQTSSPAASLPAESTTDKSEPSKSSPQYLSMSPPPFLPHPVSVRERKTSPGTVHMDPRTSPGSTNSYTQGLVSVRTQKSGGTELLGYTLSNSAAAALGGFSTALMKEVTLDGDDASTAAEDARKSSKSSRRENKSVDRMSTENPTVSVSASTNTNTASVAVMKPLQSPQARRATPLDPEQYEDAPRPKRFALPSTAAAALAAAAAAAATASTSQPVAIADSPLSVAASTSPKSTAVTGIATLDGTTTNTTSGSADHDQQHLHQHQHHHGSTNTSFNATVVGSGSSSQGGEGTSTINRKTSTTTFTTSTTRAAAAAGVGAANTPSTFASTSAAGPLAAVTAATMSISDIPQPPPLTTSSKPASSQSQSSAMLAAVAGRNGSGSGGSSNSMISFPVPSSTQGDEVRQTPGLRDEANDSFAESFMDIFGLTSHPQRLAELRRQVVERVRDARQRSQPNFESSVSSTAFPNTSLSRSITTASTAQNASSMRNFGAGGHHGHHAHQQTNNNNMTGHSTGNANSATFQSYFSHLDAGNGSSNNNNNTNNNSSVKVTTSVPNVHGSTSFLNTNRNSSSNEVRNSQSETTGAAQQSHMNNNNTTSTTQNANTPTTSKGEEEMIKDPRHEIRAVVEESADQIMRHNLHVLVYAPRVHPEMEEVLGLYGHCTTFVTNPLKMLRYANAGLQPFDVLIVEWIDCLVTPEIHDMLARHAVDETVVVYFISTKPGVHTPTMNVENVMTDTTVVIHADDILAGLLSRNVLEEVQQLIRRRRLLLSMVEMRMQQTYQIVSHIGSGAFGDVFEVLMYVSHGKLAMKRIFLKSMKLRQLEVINREVCILRALEHPNIVSFSHTQLEDNAYSIFMELCDGNLADHLLEPSTAIPGVAKRQQHRYGQSHFNGGDGYDTSVMASISSKLNGSSNNRSAGGGGGGTGSGDDSRNQSNGANSNNNNDAGHRNSGINNNNNNNNNNSLSGPALTRPQDAVMIVHDIASALVYLHSRGIIHRDIKPANILFSNGMAKLGDFGSAVKMNESRKLRNMKGTMSYMAPEMVLGEPYTEACDLWSFGCLIASIMGIHLGHLSGLHMPALNELYRSIPINGSLPLTCSNRLSSRFENHYTESTTNRVLAALKRALANEMEERERTPPPPSALHTQSAQQMQMPHSTTTSPTTSQASVSLGSDAVDEATQERRRVIAELERADAQNRQRSVMCISTTSIDVLGEFPVLLPASLVELFENLFHRDPSKRMTAADILDHPVSWDVEWMTRMMNEVQMIYTQLSMSTMNARASMNANSRSRATNASSPGSPPRGVNGAVTNAESSNLHLANGHFQANSGYGSSSFAASPNAYVQPAGYVSYFSTTPGSNGEMGGVDLLNSGEAGVNVPCAANDYVLDLSLSGGSGDDSDEE